MTILVLWKPLTFWDEEQINFIKEEEIKNKLKNDKDFYQKRSEYYDKQNEIDELENEQEDIYEEMVKMWKKYWITRDELYKYI